MLFRSLNTPLSRDEIAEIIWGKSWQSKYSDWALDKAISRLRRKINSPQYRILNTNGPDHAKQFTVGVFVKGKEEGRGMGSSKQIAEEQAAKQALEKFTTSS